MSTSKRDEGMSQTENGATHSPQKTDQGTLRNTNRNYEYGVIGNCTSAALISREGALDWLCMPEFDSASVFAKLLDENIGGSFGFVFDEPPKIEQKYIYRTNILHTVFAGEDWAFEVLDFMPRFQRANESEAYLCPSEVIRYLRPLKGTPRFRVRYDPRLNYAAGRTEVTLGSDNIKATAQAPYDSVYLYTSFDLGLVHRGEDIDLQGDAYFMIAYHQKILVPTIDDIALQYQKTKTYWMDWTHQIKRFPGSDEQVIRSALVLKLMTFESSGAVLAAITTSLPESIGEERNWDYRYCWIRDASMTTTVLTRLGQPATVRKFVNFLTNIVSIKDEKMQIMYGIRGHKELEERELAHLSGYADSKPVRVGNAAYSQKQNDIHGILIDTLWEGLYAFENHVDSLEYIWSLVRSQVRSIEELWQTPDRGIWEIRGDESHFVFSKLLCWVGVDRGVKFARRFGKKRQAEDWALLRETIKHDILKKGWNEKVGAFTQAYGRPDLDASNLLMVELGFIDADDPRFVSTVLRSKEQLTRDGLMYRYRNQDDYGVPTSSFTVCTFWLVSALHRIGEVEEARRIFEGVLSHANHLGLLSEDIDFETGRLLGNFPQAYSHLAHIASAILLGEQATLSRDERLANELVE